MQTLMKPFEIHTFKVCMNTYQQITFAIMTPFIIQITHLHQQVGKQH